MTTDTPYSMAALARANGLNPRTVRSRRRKGWSWVRTLSTPAAACGHRGPGSIASQARAAGVPPQRTADRMRLKGISVEEALTRPLSNCAARGADTVNQRAVAAGVSPSTIHARIRHGMPKEEAFTKPIDKTRNYHYQAAWHLKSRLSTTPPRRARLARLGLIVAPDATPLAPRAGAASTVPPTGRAPGGA